MDTMFNLDDCIAFTTAQSAKTFVTALEQRLRAYPVTRIQWVAMYYISRQSPITQRQLADLLGVKESSTARVLQELERSELVTHNRCSRDKRAKFLFLTPAGERVYAQLLPVVEKFKNDTIAGISQQDLQTLKETLVKMVRNAQAQVNGYQAGDDGALPEA